MECSNALAAAGGDTGWLWQSEEDRGFVSIRIETKNVTKTKTAVLTAVYVAGVVDVHAELCEQRLQTGARTVLGWPKRCKLAHAFL
jgi:hypothetical protein